MRRSRLAIIGGGPGAFIGPAHRIAAELDGEIERIAGSFRSKARRSCLHRIAPGRACRDVAAMLAGDAGREDRVDLVSLVRR